MAVGLRSLVVDGVRDDGVLIGRSVGQIGNLKVVGGAAVKIQTVLREGYLEFAVLHGHPYLLIVDVPLVVTHALVALHKGFLGLSGAGVKVLEDNTPPNRLHQLCKSLLVGGGVLVVVVQLQEAVAAGPFGGGAHSLAELQHDIRIAGRTLGVVLAHIAGEELAYLGAVGIQGIDSEFSVVGVVARLVLGYVVEVVGGLSGQTADVEGAVLERGGVGAAGFQDVAHALFNLQPGIGIAGAGRLGGTGLGVGLGVFRAGSHYNPV